MVPTIGLDFVYRFNLHYGIKLSIVGKPAFVYSTEQNIVQLMNLHYDNLLYHE